jgi:hypothetical protein
MTYASNSFYPKPSVVNAPSAIEQKILQYFPANPDAQDTLRGVLEWCLLKQRVQHSQSCAEHALRRLVREGTFKEQLGADRLGNATEGVARNADTQT